MIDLLGLSLIVLVLGCLSVIVFDIAPRKRRIELPRQAATFVLLGSLYTALTIALIYVNAWILTDIFPYAATLTMIQMIFCCLLSLFFADVPHIPLRKFVFLGLLYAVYLWGSNLAYEYLEVGFIQLLKPLGGFLIYLSLLHRGFETVSFWKILNMLAILASISIASCAQDQIGKVSWLGVGVLTASLVANALYYTVLQFTLQDDKLNPLTTMVLVGPAAALWLAVLAACTEWTRPHFKWSLPLWILAIDCALAFALNITIMYMLKAFSALTYALCGYTKDVLVVALSTFIVNERVSNLEWRAYCVMLFAQAIWIYRKVDDQAPPLRSSKALGLSCSTERCRDDEPLIDDSWVALYYEESVEPADPFTCGDDDDDGAISESTRLVMPVGSSSCTHAPPRNSAPNMV